MDRKFHGESGIPTKVSLCWIFFFLFFFDAVWEYVHLDCEFYESLQNLLKWSYFFTSENQTNLLKKKSEFRNSL